MFCIFTHKHTQQQFFANYGKINKNLVYRVWDVVAALVSDGHQLQDSDAIDDCLWWIYRKLIRLPKTSRVTLRGKLSFDFGMAKHPARNDASGKCIVRINCVVILVDRHSSRTFSWLKAFDDLWIFTDEFQTCSTDWMSVFAKIEKKTHKNRRASRMNGCALREERGDKCKYF